MRPLMFKHHQTKANKCLLIFYYRFHTMYFILHANVSSKNITTELYYQFYNSFCETIDSDQN